MYEEDKNKDLQKKKSNEENTEIKAENIKTHQNSNLYKKGNKFFNKILIKF